MMLSNYMRRVVLRHGIGLNSTMAPFSSTSLLSKSSGSAQKQMDEFWHKNKSSNRPMSPHLTIYKPQLTSMLSITTRITGCTLAGATSLFAMLTAVYSGDLASVYACVDSLKSSYPGLGLLYASKFMIAWPFTFHTCNGLRHLMWDTAQGLGLKEVYLGGWSVFIASIILADLLILFY